MHFFEYVFCLDDILSTHIVETILYFSWFINIYEYWLEFLFIFSFCLFVLFFFCLLPIQFLMPAISGKVYINCTHILMVANSEHWWTWQDSSIILTLDRKYPVKTDLSIYFWIYHEIYWVIYTSKKLLDSTDLYPHDCVANYISPAQGKDQTSKF
jgi:hypothetical protein